MIQLNQVTVLHLLIVLLFACRAASWNDVQWEKAMNQVLSHDPRVPPHFSSSEATVVSVQLYVLSFDSISESTMDYSMSLFLRQTWEDQRLTYQDVPGLEKLELDSRAMDAVWVPDLYFSNEKRAHVHEVTVPNKLMHIYPNGTVFYSVRLSLLLSCDMLLETFPFDRQECHATMESYSYTTKILKFQWNMPGVILRENLKLPQFIFEDDQIYDCTEHFPAVGNYTCLRTEFHLQRNYGYYIAQVYVPSILIVILSWVSFWLDIDAVPARISLGLLTILTMTTQSSNALSNLPRVSYIKAIDVWMAVCLMFVFAALIEFAYVNVNARVEKRRHSEMNAAHGGLKLDIGGGSRNNRTKKPDDGGQGHNDVEQPQVKRLFSKTTVGRAKARQIDKLARLIFPAVFVAFNIFYWVFYLLWKPERHGDSGGSAVKE